MSLIKVDKNNKPAGTIEKLDAHIGKGTLHRAFTCIIRNSKNQYLLTKRALYKPLWPTYWDLSFSSHPEENQDLASAVVARANFELGIKIKNPILLFDYYYQEKWSDLFAEHEYNHIFIADFDGQFDLNIKEISQAIWMDKKSLLQYIAKNQDYIAPWVLIPLDKIKKLI